MVEITTHPNDAHDAWPSVTYRGREIFDAYCDDKEIEGRIRDQNAGLDIDCQESYLGYIVDEDCFLSGWDCWYEESEECDHCWGETFDPESDDSEECAHCDANGYVESDDSQAFVGCMVKFKFAEDGGVVIVELVSTLGRMVYSDGVLGDMHIKFPSLVDIRLD